MILDQITSSSRDKIQKVDSKKRKLEQTVCMEYTRKGDETLHQKNKKKSQLVELLERTVWNLSQHVKACSCKMTWSEELWKPTQNIQIWLSRWCWSRNWWYFQIIIFHTMNQKEKIAFLDKHHWKEFNKAYSQTMNEISDKNEIFCVCWRLATWLHESSCKKFRSKVMSETLKKMKDFFKKDFTSSEKWI